MKRRYKKSLLRFLVVQNESSSKSIPEIVLHLTIKDAVYWSAQAWDELSTETLSKGWNKLLQGQIQTPASELQTPASELQTPASELQTPASELQTHASERSTSCAVDDDEFGELFQALGLHKR